MRMYIYFERNSGNNQWNISDITTYNGNNPGEWLDYLGLSGNQVGSPITINNVNLHSTDGIGLIHFEYLRLQPYFGGGNKTPTPTPTSTPTPVPTPGEPNACNGTCGTNYNCSMNYFCYGGFCRNPNCPGDSACGCTTPTPAPTATQGSSRQSTPTPQIIYYPGSVATPTINPTPSSQPGQTLATPIVTADNTVSGFNIKSNLKYILIGAFAFIALIFGFSILFKGMGLKSSVSEIKPSVIPPTTVRNTNIQQPINQNSPPE